MVRKKNVVRKKKFEEKKICGEEIKICGEEKKSVARKNKNNTWRGNGENKHSYSSPDNTFTLR